MYDTVKIVGKTQLGIVASSDGFEYYLTDCCGASATGSMGVTACRACYEEIDDALGGLPEWDAPYTPLDADDLTIIATWELQPEVVS